MTRTLRTALLLVALVVSACALAGYAPSGGVDIRSTKEPGVGCALQFNITSRSGSASTVGDRAEFAAAVTCDGPVSNFGVGFQVTATRGTNPLVYYFATTNSSGIATMGYTRSQPGADRIVAYNPINRPAARSVAPDITHEWVPRPPPPPPQVRVSLTPAGTSGRVGAQFTVSADVTADGKPAPGPTVLFTRSMPGAPVESVSVTGSRTGHAEWTYTRNVPGTETISAVAIYDGVRAQAAPINRVWEEEPCPGPPTCPPDSPGPDSPGPDSPGPDSPGPDSPGPDSPGPDSPGPDSPGPDSPGTQSPDPSDSPTETPTETPTESPTETPTETPKAPTVQPDRIRLTPDRTSTFVSEDFAARAKVADGDGEPLEGVRVAFSARMSGAERVDRVVRTDERGRAELLYTRLEPGKERVRAAVGKGASALKASIRHTWQAPVEDPVTCQQATATSVTASGEVTFVCGGCPTGAPIAMSVDGTPLTATTQSDADAATVVGTLPGIPPGTHSATLSCGGRDAVVSVPVVGVTTSASSVGGSAGTAGAVLLFFVLVGWLLLPRWLRSPASLGS